MAWIIGKVAHGCWGRGECLEEALAPVPYSRVTFGEGYWDFARRLLARKACGIVTVAWKVKATSTTFEAVAGSRSTPRRGLPVFDSDVYKWLEAVGWDAWAFGHEQ